MRIAIVGHAADKFTPETEAGARQIIRQLLADPADICISGQCPLGGVDIYAVEEAVKLGRTYTEFPPKTRHWSTGYAPRNLLIAKNCDIIHVLVVSEYPPGYDGMHFGSCYHCHTTDHIKSGGCWTAKKALGMGKQAEWHIIGPDFDHVMTTDAWRPTGSVVVTSLDGSGGDHRPVIVQVERAG